MKGTPATTLWRQWQPKWQATTESGSPAKLRKFYADYAEPAVGASPPSARGRP